MFKLNFEKTIKGLSTGQIIYWETKLGNGVWGFGYKIDINMFVASYYWPDTQERRESTYAINALADLGIQDFNHFEVVVDPISIPLACKCEWLTVLHLGCRCGSIIPYSQRRAG